MTQEGKFIVFEGLDNTGKSTVSKLIMLTLEGMGIKCKLTRHPGETPVGKELRQILKHSPEPIGANAQALLFAADNSMFMEQILKPELDKGTWVIGDRNNFISSMAYQIASGCSLEELDKVHDATKQTAKMDLLFVFQCSFDERKRRRALREAMDGKEPYDRFEDTDREYHEKLSECYGRVLDDTKRLTKFMNDPSKIFTINANKNVDEVASEIKRIIISELASQESVVQQG